MKHQVLVVFAASLKGKDGDGVRLCLGVKEIDPGKVPTHNETLTFAGFGFRQFRDPSREDETTTYFLEPTRAVRHETFNLNLDDIHDRKQIRSRGGNRATAGVLVSAGSSNVMKLIESLKRQGYTVLIGDTRDGGFNPYPPTQ